MEAADRRRSKARSWERYKKIVNGKFEEMGIREGGSQINGRKKAVLTADRFWFCVSYSGRGTGSLVFIRLGGHVLA